MLRHSYFKEGWNPEDTFSNSNNDSLKDGGEKMLRNNIFYTCEKAFV